MAGRALRTNRAQIDAAYLMWLAGNIPVGASDPYPRDAWMQGAMWMLGRCRAALASALTQTTDKKGR